MTEADEARAQRHPDRRDERRRLAGRHEPDPEDEGGHDREHGGLGAWRGIVVGRGRSAPRPSSWPAASVGPELRLGRRTVEGIGGQFDVAGRDVGPGRLDGRQDHARSR